ncbi:MAG: hypothetical protein AB7O62_24995, partial [Pirellulales bacterium]
MEPTPPPDDAPSPPPVRQIPDLAGRHASPPPRRRRRLGWVIGFLLIGTPLLLSCLLLSFVGSLGGTDSALTQHFHSGDKYGSDKVAIITVSGTILDGEGFVKKQIDAVREDKSVRAVVLRVDSPGGTVTGSDYIYHHLNRLCDEKGKELAQESPKAKARRKIQPLASDSNRLPLVVSMGGMAASGGYYVSMACGTEKDVIFAE